jgi:hypothetical protein
MTPIAAAWKTLTIELDLWAAGGHRVDLWWRDDDAVEPTPALGRLLSLQEQTEMPLALAIIPGLAKPDLARCLEDRTGVAALQHGFMHHNHADADSKKSEFPQTRPLALRLADIRTGQAKMQAWFPDRLLPILVPPWNRIAVDLLPELPHFGFTAVSGFTSRPQHSTAPGLAWLNTHIDPIDWHSGDVQAGLLRSLATAVDTLRAIRQGSVALQPLGLLTHHLRHEEAVWAFVRDFLDATRHPAVRRVDAATALALGIDAAVIPWS